MEPDNKLLIHVVMGDLARFYMAEANDVHTDVSARFWRVVEELAADGDQAVESCGGARVPNRMVRLG